MLEISAVADACQLIDGRKQPIIRDHGLQRCREADDAPGVGQMCPELLAATLLRHYVIRTCAYPFDRGDLCSLVDKYDMNGRSGIQLARLADQVELIGKQDGVQPHSEAPQSVGGIVGLIDVDIRRMEKLDESLARGD